ncbi:glycosyltransferase family 1 protein [bacterium]|nr:glycosyltransferase family 1 protein [bacterium]
MAFEENEISKKSQGGTEMMKRGLASRLPEGLADDFQIICSRVRELDEEKIRVYWLHDLPEDPETNHLADSASRDRFHKLVFCGQWQYYRYQHMLGVPYDGKAVVIETAIDPIEFKPKSKNEIRLVYTSTPQRGLSILVPVFEKLAEKYDNIVLDVFSSFKIYGWDDADKQYESLYERCRNHPRINYHGYATNEEVRATVQNAHILAYPSIWTECNSRSVIEAMSAGCLCVHPNKGGLIDTAGGMTYMYQGHDDVNKHATAFYHALDNAIEVVNTDDVQNYLQLTKAYADSRFNWTKITQQWVDLLSGLKQEYSEVSSRAFSKGPMFVYNTL